MGPARKKFKSENVPVSSCETILTTDIARLPTEVPDCIFVVPDVKVAAAVTRSGNSVSDPDEIVERPGHITHLPTEIFTEIFAMLDTRSKGSCARVCWDWMVTVNQRCLWRDDTFLWWSQYMKNPALRETLKIRKMRKLALKVSKEDGNVCFEKLLLAVTSSMPNEFELTELILTDNHYISDMSFMNAAGRFTQLVRLDVGRLPRTLTDAFVMCIAYCCRRLTHLSLGDCFHLTGAGYVALLGGLRHPQLEYLKMDDCVRLSNRNLSCLSSRHPQLKQLSLRNAYTLSDDGLHHLSKLKNLKELSIQGASWITIEEIESFSARAKLDVLDLDYWDEGHSTPAIDSLLKRFRGDSVADESYSLRFFS